MDEQRLQELETTVARILDRLRRLESRLDLQKESPAVIVAAPTSEGSQAPKQLLPSGAMVARLLQLVGRTCLVLGGAFLIRALSDGRVLSLGVGIALALALATASLGFSYRAAKLGQGPRRRVSRHHRGADRLSFGAGNDDSAWRHVAGDCSRGGGGYHSAAAVRGLAASPHGVGMGRRSVMLGDDPCFDAGDRRNG